MPAVREFEGTSQEIIQFLRDRPQDHLYRITELDRTGRVPTPAEIAAADARLLEHAVDLYPPSGLDNDQIDADLAREYGSSHSDHETVKK